MSPPSDQTLPEIRALREIIKLSLDHIGEKYDDLGSKIDGLSRGISQIEGTLRQVEINSTKRIAELQKDVSNLYDEVDSLKKAVNNVSINVEQEESVRQLTYNNFKEAFDNFKEMQSAKWTEQVKQNDRVSTVIKLIWFVASIVLAEIVLLFINMVLYGGLAGVLGK